MNKEYLYKKKQWLLRHQAADKKRQWSLRGGRQLHDYFCLQTSEFPGSGSGKSNSGRPWQISWVGETKATRAYRTESIGKLHRGLTPPICREPHLAIQSNTWGNYGDFGGPLKVLWRNDIQCSHRAGNNIPFATSHAAPLPSTLPQHLFLNKTSQICFPRLSLFLLTLATVTITMMVLCES